MTSVKIEVSEAPVITPALELHEHLQSSLSFLLKRNGFVENCLASSSWVHYVLRVCICVLIVVTNPSIKSSNPTVN